ncbi:MAG TPA: hypothetical protein VG502_11120 [Flexivirga sp.]|uniref:hypothetical protein n=1 Tax=Flexivirga sp. TaxID=1962927 RepID=UPI002D13A744|nr:hypothetical protein [Flexivirga sp.]HWC22840.1 hypothetical protein [Flexivirga sp.]
MSTGKTTGRLTVLVAAASLLTACGSAGTAAQAGHPGSPTSTGQSSAAANPKHSQQSSAAHGPANVDVADAPDTATMVCSDELRDSIARLLRVSSVPRGHATWDGTVYTCRYNLTAGPLVLVVHQSGSKAAAERQLKAREKALGGRAITGLQSLGLPAFQDRAGTVGFAKDDFTLLVDASKLSGTLGSPDTSQTDFAYTVATDVLACWSHD